MKTNEKGQFIKRDYGDMFENFAVWYDNKGYPIIYIDGKEVKLHVYIWERANGAKPKGTEIHHLDRDKRNCELSNLKLVTLSEHRRLHAGWIMENGLWIAKPCNRCGRIYPLDKFYQRRGYTPTALCKACHNDSTKERTQRMKKIKQEVPNAR
jgi:hypothetical protein